uniref:Uncharacterized protein n=1 Tax=Xiphophorus couchianus TaxID=32473 RepID=A0A3B5KYY8_9TELE
IMFSCDSSQTPPSVCLKSHISYQIRNCLLLSCSGERKKFCLPSLKETFHGPRKRFQNTHFTGILRYGPITLCGGAALDRKGDGKGNGTHIHYHCGIHEAIYFSIKHVDLKHVILSAQSALVI